MSLLTAIEQRANRILRSNTAGLDISDRSAKYFAFEDRERKGIKRISVWGEFAIPEGLIVQGEVRDEAGLTRVLSAWRADERKIPRSAFFNVSLPEEKSFLRILQLPNLQENDIEHAIRWEIEANIPLPFEELIYDYEVVAPPSTIGSLDHVDIVVSAFPKALIEAYVRVLRGAGMRLAALELESQAMVRAAVPDLQSAEANILVDMGRTRTSYVIFVGGTIIFTTTVPVGGAVFESAIARALGVSDKDAARIKKEVGLARDGHTRGVSEVLLPSLTILAEELRRAIAYYRDHALHVHGGSPAVERILLSGGDANLSGLDTYLASNIRIPVAYVDPFIMVRDMTAMIVPPIPRTQAVAFTAVIGLALRGIRPGA